MELEHFYLQSKLNKISKFFFTIFSFGGAGAFLFTDYNKILKEYKKEN